MPTSNLEEVFDLIFGQEGSQRFTQDSPILPEVWFMYLTEEHPPVIDLLFNPYHGQKPSQLQKALLECLGHDSGQRRRKPLVFNETHVVGELGFDQLIRCALPLTRWWSEYVWRKHLEQPEEIGTHLTARVEHSLKGTGDKEFSDDFLWLVQVIGYYAEKHRSAYQSSPAMPGQLTSRIEYGLHFLSGMPLPAHLEKEESQNAAERRTTPHMLWSVSLNRRASRAVSKSCPAVKADAAKQLFGISCKNITWGIIDSGVDARHPAFRRRDLKGRALKLNDPDWQMQSRVTRTYDFTKLRTLMDPDGSASEVWVEGDKFTRRDREKLKAARERIAELKDRLKGGRMLNWEELEPHLRISHDNTYAPPNDEHGTHVAGILAASWRIGDLDGPPAVNGAPEPMEGMCPDIQVFDLRVLDDQGHGTEFEVLAALQFVRYLNTQGALPIVHGVNLSLSIPHDAASFACGRTPVCDECQRLIGNGIVVVVAAGNKGYSGRSKLAAAFALADYQDISITDPGNAEGVITVGSTHRNEPHTYGVSYFSSRGPTGDGRAKPDLVAPGEKIKSVIPKEQVKSMDGTSMAAPHVSGAAALLMARHKELIGQPDLIKKTLCGTATDLGRTREFQGAGMVDILRAIQSL